MNTIHCYDNRKNLNKNITYRPKIAHISRK